MNDLAEKQKRAALNAKAITGMGIFAAVVAIPWSFMPFIGVFALPWGILGLLFTGISIFLRKRLGLRLRWSIVALILCLIGTALGLNKYLAHKWAVDFLVAGPVGKVKMIVESDVEPSEKKLDDQISNSSNTDAIKSTKDNELGGTTPNYKMYSRYHVPISTFYYSMFENLRMRSAPDLGSEVLLKLKFGEQIKYLGEKTDKKERITLGGQEMNDVWYKVSSTSSGEVVGWVYGGAIINANSEGIETTNKGIIKPYNFIEEDELISLMGRSGASNKLFSGLMSYKHLPSGSLIKEGQFYFEGISSDDYFGNQQYGPTESHEGTMKNNELDGAFRSKESLFESWVQLDINFDQGTCISYNMEHNKEGEIDRAVSSNPEDCSYNFIYSKLKPIN